MEGGGCGKEGLPSTRGVGCGGGWLKVEREMAVEMEDAQVACVGQRTCALYGDVQGRGLVVAVEWFVVCCLTLCRCVLVTRVSGF